MRPASMTEAVLTNSAPGKKAASTTLRYSKSCTKSVWVSRLYTKKLIDLPQEKPGKENAYIIVANTCEDANHSPLVPNR